ncbi:lipopolysaccharide biosynthesis protein [Cohnella zeiphila]|uniref:Oligosaccharide flippase family protein n=1 Tax=Cohnella zeiphila TaxID=2761120 RepID=A0A7X0SQ83_9BACL|nr:oligosaccharide flippase family protein [Cohnella zeiphila]MBB6733064.1 oligosaccharide flippase family protein [Cohnella zeiphila]
MKTAALKYLKRLVHEQFVRNVFVLASGTLFSQVLILATLPIVTHLYSPSDYGIFAVYSSVISIVLVVVSLSYEVTIPIAKDDRTASSMVHLCLYLCILMSLIFGGAFYGLHDKLAVWLDAPDLRKYYYLFAASLLCAGVYNVLNFWSIRKEYFKPISRTKYFQSMNQVSTQLLLSLTHTGPLGLMYGDLIGRMTGIWNQWKLWRKDVRNAGIRTTWAEIKSNASRYKRFPLLSSGSHILNSLGLYLPNILLAWMYGPNVAGLFTLAQRLLGAPTTLVSISVSQVYLSNFAIHANQNPEKVVPLFMGTLRKVLITGIVIIGAVTVASPYLFHYLFGKQWEGTEPYLRIMSIMYLSQFVANAVGATIDVMERQDLHLIREVVRILMVLAALLSARYTHQNALTAATMLSAASTLGYALHLTLSWISVRKYRTRNSIPEVATALND